MQLGVSLNRDSSPALLCCFLVRIAKRLLSSFRRIIILDSSIADDLQSAIFFAKSTTGAPGSFTNQGLVTSTSSGATYNVSDKHTEMYWDVTLTLPFFPGH